MKRTRNQHHYAVLHCKSNKLNIQKQKLSENIRIRSHIWREIYKINPANNFTPTIIMNTAKCDKEITSLLVNEYDTLYSSVPTVQMIMRWINYIQLLMRLVCLNKDKVWWQLQLLLLNVCNNKIK